MIQMNKTKHAYTQHKRRERINLNSLPSRIATDVKQKRRGLLIPSCLINTLRTLLSAKTIKKDHENKENSVRSLRNQRKKQKELKF